MKKLTIKENIIHKEYNTRNFLKFKNKHKLIESNKLEKIEREKNFIKSNKLLIF